MSESQVDGRTALAYKPGLSEAVLNITTYRFGTDEEATRADRVLRIPTAAIVLHCRGRVLQYREDEGFRPLPEITLLGPDTRARTWATEPGTKFMMANLAPGATRALLDVEPADIEDQTQSIGGYSWAESLGASGDCCPETFHQVLVSHIHSGEKRSFTAHRRRIHAVIAALINRKHGERVRDYADHFGVTSRTLQRIVKSEIGLAPKQILSIGRLRDMITITNGGWPGSAADLAQIGGYFDQSHMRHELERLSFGSISNLVSGEHLVVRH